MLQFSPQEVEIIDALKRQRELSLAALVGELKANKSSVYYQLQALIKKGVVQEAKRSPKHIVYRTVPRAQLEKIILHHQKEVAALLLQAPPAKGKTGKKPKLVFSDGYVLPDEMLGKLRKRYDVISYLNTPSHISKELFMMRCKDADVAITFFSVVITREMLLACPRLKVLITASISTECIDLAACDELGIEVRSLDRHNSWKEPARIEFILGSLFGLLRPLGPIADGLRLGQFDYKGYHASELRGKAVGIVGAKREGKEVIPLLQALGCAVYVADPDKSVAHASDIGLTTLSSLEELFASCDIIIFAEDFYADKVVIDERLLNERMRVSYLFCFSISAKLDIMAIRKLLISQKLKGVAIDYFSEVFNIFNNFVDSEYRHIMNFPNVLITPEVGYFTDESMQRNYIEVFEMLKTMEIAA